MTQKIVIQNQELRPETLISQAIEKGVPVETMEKLLAMRRELKAEFDKAAFDDAMSKFQANCPVIKKKKKVSFGTTNYSYAPLDEIVEQVKGEISTNGFSYTFDTKQNENAITIFCKVKHKLGHSEVSEFEIEIDNAAKMNKSQQYGAALTYGKRYAFCNAFGILTGDEDIDAQVKPVNASQKSIKQSPVEPEKTQIKHLCDQIDPILETKEDYEKFVERVTALKLEPKNYQEIISRLEITLKEKGGAQ